MQVMRGTALLILVGYAAVSIPAWAAGGPALGVPNFHEVNEHVYRGAQPSAQGWDSLAKLGVKTVIDLRPEGEHSVKAEQRAVEAAGMQYVNVPLGGMAAPPDKKISTLLTLLDDPTGPVFVHCRRGADRTGTVIACYRVKHDGWTNRKALHEAVTYGMSWVEFGMQRYILNFHAETQTIGAQPPR